MNIQESSITPLFTNSSIKRSLQIKDIEYILGELEKLKLVESRDKNSYFIYFKSLNEWAELVYKYIQDSGRLGNVFTLFELLNGDETEGLEFHGMDQQMFIKVLHVLKSSGKAQVFNSTSGDQNDLGVKFF